jgi:soluble lytic murein transglycosylase-like protein
MQLMPATASQLQVEDAFHPGKNIEGGTRYLRYLLNVYHGNLTLALAAYNAGEGAVAKYNNRIPPYRETQNYVKRVLNFYKTFSK